MSSTYGEVSEHDAVATIAAAFEVGITFFDTADFYGPHHNENLLGRTVSKRKSPFLISTKFGFQVDKDQRLQVNGTPEYVKACASKSLERLKVQQIDLFLQHRLDPDTSIETTVSAMAELQKDKIVRFIGLCEVSPDTLRRAHSVAEISALQIEYSLWERTAELDLIPLCEELNISVITYSPLGRGFLTGNAASADRYPNSDYRHSDPRFSRNNYNSNSQSLTALRQVARQYNASMAQIALAWVLSKSTKTIAIPGSSNPSHVRDNAKSSDIQLHPSDIDFLESNFPIGATQGERYASKFKLSLLRK